MLEGNLELKMLRRFIFTRVFCVRTVADKSKYSDQRRNRFFSHSPAAFRRTHGISAVCSFSVLLNLFGKTVAGESGCSGTGFGGPKSIVAQRATETSE